MKIHNTFINNDIYFMETIQDKIIINDNYCGVFILDSDFNIIKNIHTFEDMVIDTYFANENEMILYCFENHCFVYLNIDSYIFKVISICDELFDINYLPLYKWKDNNVILMAENGTVVVCVDVLTCTVKQIHNNSYNEIICQLKSNWKKLNGLIVHKMYPEINIAVVSINNTLKIINYESSDEFNMNVENVDFHDIEIKKNYKVLISEYIVFVSSGNKNINLYPFNKEYRFLRAKFLVTEQNKYLLLLECSNIDSLKCKIERYYLDEDLFDK